MKKNYYTLKLKFIWFKKRKKENAVSYFTQNGIKLHIIISHEEVQGRFCDFEEKNFTSGSPRPFLLFKPSLLRYRGLTIKLTKKSLVEPR